MRCPYLQPRGAPPPHYLRRRRHLRPGRCQVPDQPGAGTLPCGLGSSACTCPSSWRRSASETARGTTRHMVAPHESRGVYRASTRRRQTLFPATAICRTCSGAYPPWSWPLLAPLAWAGQLRTLRLQQHQGHRYGLHADDVQPHIHTSTHPHSQLTVPTPTPTLSSGTTPPLAC